MSHKEYHLSPKSSVQAGNAATGAPTMDSLPGSADAASRTAWIRWEKWSLAAGDASALSLAFMLGRLTHLLRPGWTWDEALFSWWGQRGDLRAVIFLSLVVALVLWFWTAIGHYTRRRPFWQELHEIVRALFLAACFDAALVFLGKVPFSRLSVVITWAAALVLVPLARYTVKMLLMRAGAWMRPSVIVGVGANAREAYDALLSEPLMGYRPFAFLTVNDADIPESGGLEFKGGECIPVFLIEADPEAMLERLGRPQVVVAMEAEQFSAQQELIMRLSLGYQDVNVLPPIRGLPLYGMDVAHFFNQEVLFLTVRNNLARKGPLLLKRTFDVVVSAGSLMLLSPLLLYVAWRIRQEDGGPVIYVQPRVGMDGRVFQCYKFRSMRVDAEDALTRWQVDNPELWASYRQNNFKLQDDPRVTRVGRWLRRTSIDELPQIWNVLIGEMSLVGPRPLLERELPDYGDSIRLYYKTKPGITGLWQISGRSGTSFGARVAMDAWYVRNWSIWYDIAILVKTVGVVLRGDGAY